MKVKSERENARSGESMKEKEGLHKECVGIKQRTSRREGDKMMNEREVEGELNKERDEKERKMINK